MAEEEYTPVKFLYNPTCIKEIEGCYHAVRIDSLPLEAWPGSQLYIHLKNLGRDIPAHLQHYKETCDAESLPELPDEDDIL